MLGRWIREAAMNWTPDNVRAAEKLAWSSPRIRKIDADRPMIEKILTANGYSAAGARDKASEILARR
jgi:hypothetical protein